MVGTATRTMKRPQAVAGAAIRPKKSWKSKKPAMGAANDTKKIHSKQAVGTATASLQWFIGIGMKFITYLL